MTTRAALAGLLVGLSLTVVVAWGRPGSVTTKDGGKYEGDVTERGNAVVIKPASGQPITLNKGNVADIQYFGSTADQFKDRMSKLGKNDVAGRIALARTAIDQGEFDHALEAIDAAIAIDPNNEEALQMRRSVAKQRQLARRPGGKAGGPADAAAPDAAAPPASTGDRPARPRDRRNADAGGAQTRAAGPIRLVTPQEINRIRQLELQPSDKVQVRFENDVRRKYQQSSEFSAQQWNGMAPQAQAMEILNNGSSRLHPDVLIATDPASIAQFKSLVQRNVLVGCAAAACHGTRDKAGDFFLHNPASKDAELYTNFLLMQGYKSSIDDREHLMIDRARAENSLLLQYGLPQDVADVPHPDAQNFRPMYKGKRDPKFQQTVDWLSKTLAPVAPEYGVDLTREPGDEGNASTRPTRGDDRGAGAGAGGERRPAREPAPR